MFMEHDQMTAEAQRIVLDLLMEKYDIEQLIAKFVAEEEREKLLISGMLPSDIG